MVYNSEKSKKWYQDNKDKLKTNRKELSPEAHQELLAKQRERYAKDPTHMKECNKKSYIKNHEKRIEYQKRYYKSLTPEQIAHREEIMKVSRKKYYEKKKAERLLQK